MRRSVTKEIKSDPTACEEFFVLVLEAHILSIAMSAFGLESLDGTPNCTVFEKSNFLDESPSRRKEIFMSSVKRLVSDNMYEYVLGKTMKDVDTVLVYGKELLSLGMLYLEFSDAIKEGDGTRLLRCWKYLLLVFKATNKNKYAAQAATLLLQYNYVFTERMKNQLLWSRTINTSGRKGRNIPMDLHMEHLNRDLKQAIGHLSSNVNNTTIDRIAKSLHKLSIIKSNFDSCTEVAQGSSYHSTPSFSKDLKLVLDELMKTDVYKRTQGRRHSQFKNMKGNTVGKVNKEKLELWLKDHFNKLLRTL
jgi:L1 cell adhesion molecule like protein